MLKSLILIFVSLFIFGGCGDDCPVNNGVIEEQKLVFNTYRYQQDSENPYRKMFLPDFGENIILSDINGNYKKLLDDIYYQKINNIKILVYNYDYDNPNRLTTEIDTIYYSNIIPRYEETIVEDYEGYQESKMLIFDYDIKYGEEILQVTIYSEIKSILDKQYGKHSYFNFFPFSYYTIEPKNKNQNGYDALEKYHQRGSSEIPYFQLEYFY